MFSSYRLIVTKNYFTKNGVPKCRSSKNRRMFSKKKFKNFFQSYEVKAISGLPNLHKATGLVERTKNNEDKKKFTESVQITLKSIKQSYTQELRIHVLKYFLDLVDVTIKYNRDSTEEQRALCQREAFALCQPKEHSQRGDVSVKKTTIMVHKNINPRLTEGNYKQHPATN